MTSNVGANYIKKQSRLGFTAEDDEAAEYDNMKDNVMTRLRKTFRPEFLNRLDETIVFHSLNKEHISKIIEIMIRELQERLDQKDIKIEISKKAKSKLVDEGYNAEFGARPLRRAIQKLVENKLSEHILSGDIGEGDQVNVDQKEDELVFNKVK